MAPSTFPRISRPFGFGASVLITPALIAPSSRAAPLSLQTSTNVAFPALSPMTPQFPQARSAWRGTFRLAAAAVASPAVSLLFEFVDRDALVASLVLDDELAFVDLFLVDRVRVHPELVGDHLPGSDRRDSPPAVHPDHDDVVQVDLLALGKLIEPHHVAALDRHRDLRVACTVKVLLDELRHEQRPAVERPCCLVDLLWIGDEHRDRIVEVLSPCYGKHPVDHLLLERIFQEARHGTAALCLLRRARRQMSTRNTYLLSSTCLLRLRDLLNGNGTVLQLGHLGHRVECGVREVVRTVREVHRHIQDARSHVVGNPGNRRGLSPAAADLDMLPFR